MARKQLFEHSAKQLLLSKLAIPYAGIRVTPETVGGKSKSPNSKERFVVKVDVGIKKRFKQGLVRLDQTKDQIEDVITDFAKKGYTSCIIEPDVQHNADEEKYIAFERVREGIQIYYATQGGVDIESLGNVSQVIASSASLKEVSNALSIPQTMLEKILSMMDEFFFSFLEINPLLVQGDTITFLDVAAEVDDTAMFFVHDGWVSSDFASGSTKVKTKEEEAIDLLSEQSQASFRLEVLNQNGSIFMLLSGGGASIVLADEVGNKGFGRELANYGEYSGNPSAEETYIYTKQLLQLLIMSTAKKKVLVIGGGVANFTDVRVTFQGLMKAIAEFAEELRKQSVKVFVRRGGPHQEEGLSQMKLFLEKEHLLGEVDGPDKPLTSIVTPALQEVSHA